MEMNPLVVNEEDYLTERSSNMINCESCYSKKSKCDRAVPICGRCEKSGTLCLYNHNRKTLACLSCSKKKIKCDKQKPACSKCASTNSTCEYPTYGGYTKARKKTKKDTVNSDQVPEYSDDDEGQEKGRYARKKSPPMSTASQVPLNQPFGMVMMNAPVPGQEGGGMFWVQNPFTCNSVGMPMNPVPGFPSMTPGLAQSSGSEYFFQGYPTMMPAYFMPANSGLQSCGEMKFVQPENAPSGKPIPVFVNTCKMEDTVPFAKSEQLSSQEMEGKEHASQLHAVNALEKLKNDATTKIEQNPLPDQLDTIANLLEQVPAAEAEVDFSLLASVFTQAQNGLASPSKQNVNPPVSFQVVQPFTSLQNTSEQSSNTSFNARAIAEPASQRQSDLSFNLQSDPQLLQAHDGPNAASHPSPSAADAQGFARPKSSTQKKMHFTFDNALQRLPAYTGAFGESQPASKTTAPGGNEALPAQPGQQHVPFSFPTLPKSATPHHNSRHAPFPSPKASAAFDEPRPSPKTFNGAFSEPRQSPKPSLKINTGTTFGEPLLSPKPYNNSFGEPRPSPKPYNNSFGEPRPSPKAHSGSFCEPRPSPKVYNGSFGEPRPSPKVTSFGESRQAFNATFGDPRPSPKLSLQINTATFGEPSLSPKAFNGAFGEVRPSPKAFTGFGEPRPSPKASDTKEHCESAPPQQSKKTFQFQAPRLLIPSYNGSFQETRPSPKSFSGSYSDLRPSPRAYTGPFGEPLVSPKSQNGSFCEPRPSPKGTSVKGSIEPKLQQPNTLFNFQTMQKSGSSFGDSRPSPRAGAAQRDSEFAAAQHPQMPFKFQTVQKLGLSTTGSADDSSPIPEVTAPKGSSAPEPITEMQPATLSNFQTPLVPACNGSGANEQSLQVLNGQSSSADMKIAELEKKMQQMAEMLVAVQALRNPVPEKAPVAAVLPGVDQLFSSLESQCDNLMSELASLKGRLSAAPVPETVPALPAPTLPAKKLTSNRVWTFINVEIPEDSHSLVLTEEEDGLLDQVQPVFGLMPDMGLLSTVEEQLKQTDYGDYIIAFIHRYLFLAPGMVDIPLVQKRLQWLQKPPCPESVLNEINHDASCEPHYFTERAVIAAMLGLGALEVGDYSEELHEACKSIVSESLQFCCGEDSFDVIAAHGIATVFYFFLNSPKFYKKHIGFFNTLSETTAFDKNPRVQSIAGYITFLNCLQQRHLDMVAFYIQRIRTTLHASPHAAKDFPNLIQRPEFNMVCNLTSRDKSRLNIFCKAFPAYQATMQSVTLISIVQNVLFGTEEPNGVKSALLVELLIFTDKLAEQNGYTNYSMGPGLSWHAGYLQTCLLMLKGETALAKQLMLEEVKNIERDPLFSLSLLTFPQMQHQFHIIASAMSALNLSNDYIVFQTKLNKMAQLLGLSPVPIAVPTAHSRLCEDTNCTIIWTLVSSTFTPEYIAPINIFKSNNR